jgi:hypothetical protein
MKRTFATVVLLAALGVLFKLAWKVQPQGVTDVAARNSAVAPKSDPDADLRARFPAERALVDRVLREYHHNALAIARTDGVRGLVLLDRLGLEAVFLYDKYPKEFRRLRDMLNDAAAADLLVHWREYFGLKRADERERGLLIAEIAALTPAQKRAAARYPNALPLILAEPVGTTELIEHWRGDPDDLRDALAALDFISLEPGAADLRGALRTFEDHGPLALDAFRLQGPEGFALAKLYGEVLETLGDALPLEQALILLRVNSDDIDQLLGTHPPETVAGYLRHVASAGLVEAVGGSPHGLRLTVDFGSKGDQALAAAGPGAAEVVYDEYTEGPLRAQAVAALAEHGATALAMLEKYAPDGDFREILRRYGPRVIPPVAQVDPGPEALAVLRAKDQKSFTEVLAQGVLALSGDSGQATIRMIRSDGIERVEALNSSQVEFYQFLPLYDLLHLGSVVSRGHAPTTGETTWAVIDGCFVVADALSLLAVQPEGAVASEAARAEVKAATKQAARSAGRELVEAATESTGRNLARGGADAAAGHLARWWAVRLAGGTYRVLLRVPEALAKMSVADVARLGRPLCAKAGLRLSTWAPVRLLKNGRTFTLAIPPGRGIKYVAAQALQASVGVVGIQKMEEHLASRRPQTD